MRRKKILGNLTPRMALEELGAVRDLTTYLQRTPGIVPAQFYTSQRLERLLTNHVRAAIERAARRR